MNHASLLELLTQAVNAPSGDNSQPWRFSIEGHSIVVYNAPNADATLYNFRERGSILAHGALVENIVALAAARGWSAAVTALPGALDATARIDLSEGAGDSSPLAAGVARRVTNRKPYRAVPLRAEDRTALMDAVAPAAGATLRLCESASDLDALARAISTNERLVMENRTLHDFLFGLIRWSRDEEAKKPGLFVDTMELPPAVRFLFRHVLTHWSVVQLLNLVGFSRFIATQSAPVYRASAAFGAVVITGDEDADFFAAGRAFERVWLTTTSRGLALQPTTALPYLLQRVRAGETSEFSPASVALIESANRKIARVFSLSGSEHVAMLFRVGYADAPSATSTKCAPRMRE